MYSIATFFFSSMIFLKISKEYNASMVYLAVIV
jgi:hypothetical protein